MANSYLNRTTGSPSNADKITVSAWVKRSGLGFNVIIGDYGSSTNRGKLQFNTDNRIEYYQVDGGSATVHIRTNRKFRDISAWYHIVMQYDSAQSTASDRLKLYVNGVQETSLETSTYPPQNQDTRLNKSGVNLHIGQDGNNANYVDGYISHIALVDNAIVAPTTFGETDSTSGIWKFKSPSGVTWGNNGFHLKFENSGALGTDSSGNTNTFTVNGNLKQAVDTPSNVYATINTLDKDLTGTAATISYGNNRFSSSGNSSSNNGMRCTLGASSGKYYWEVKNVQNDLLLGIQDADAITRFTSSWTWGLTGTYAVKSNGEKSINGTGTNNAVPTFTTGDILMLAMDLDNQKLYFGKNGTWVNSGDPTSGSTGTGSLGNLVSGTTYVPVVSNASWGQNTIADFNFGNGYFGTTAITSAGSNGNGSLFEYDVPSGYYALNTKNINTYG